MKKKYITDLRRQRDFLAEIRRAKDAAEIASRAKSTFLATMSHEIRTPMNSIIGFTELAQNTNDIEKIKSYHEKILENAVLLLVIINDILDIAKIESGKLKLENTPFDLHEILSQCRIVAAPKAEEKGLTLYCYAEPSVGKKILGDPVRLRQALLNLLSNAVKFTNTGFVKLMASIKESKENSVTIRFEVKDSGIGMKKEQLEKIFEPFMQGEDSVTRKFGGTGLGLSITKGFLEMMGSKLEVDSAPGIGSKFGFEITFDTVDDDLEIANPLQDSMLPVMEKPHFEGDILICEDNLMNQQVICEHLSEVGLNSFVAQNGKEGVELVSNRIKNKEKMFDLILMDIHMPEIDGLEAAVKIREIEKTVPIIALTANVMSNDIELYSTNGISGFLGKPFTSQELWNCLLNYLAPAGVSIEKEEFTEKEEITPENKLRPELIKSFVNSSQNKIREIQKAILEDDTVTAYKLAHTLTDKACLLEFHRLCEAAKDAEDSLANENNLVIKEKFDVLEKELNFILESLTAEKDSLAASDNKMDSYQILVFMEILKSLLENGNAECLNLKNDLKAIPNTEEIVRHIEEFEFEQALLALVKFSKSLNSSAL